MVQLFNNFTSDIESDELIMFYSSNIEETYLNQDTIYSFKAKDIDNYSDFLISNKFKLHKPPVLRVQAIDNTVKVNSNTHTHTTNWNYILFLNDDFDGGELIIENITVKPLKNQLVMFSGNAPHKVLPVTNGIRYTLVVFSDDKGKFISNVI